MEILAGRSPVTEAPEREDPSLVMVIEFGDRLYSSVGDENLKPGDFHIVEWTLLAKKGHPIMLDAVGEGLFLARGVRQDRLDRKVLHDWSKSGIM